MTWFLSALIGLIVVVLIALFIIAMIICDRFAIICLVGICIFVFVLCTIAVHVMLFG